jgi:hypothetical protein
MKRSLLLPLLLLPVLLICSIISFAQNPKKEVGATKAASAIRIDGVLDEPAWSDAPAATDFIQINPYNGKPASFRTEVRFLYDNSGLYIGAMMYDPYPDSIPRQLGLRDSDWLNADDFTLVVSPFDDGVNALVFKLYSSDVQSDYKLPYANGDGDFTGDLSWDAVWQSKAGLNDKGWVAEIRIPWSAVRFPDEPVQKWGMNCYRNIRRFRELSSWNFVDQKIQGQPNQEGMLLGIGNIKPPLRLSLTPYVSGYVQKNPGDEEWSFSYNYGADLKYGINQSFTLDMTLIPDFGQVQSDYKIYNFSPFEIQYAERRQFFTEGTELFNKGDVFYSRRVGSEPTGYNSVYDSLLPGETVSDNPANTRIINATKISGNTNKGLGIGFFNAMSANTWATVKDSAGNERRIMTQGFTNYNMLVFNQALKNNSYFAVLNTNVYTPESKYCADVTGIDFKFANKKYTYGIMGNAFMSQKFSESAPPDRGYHYYLSFGKLSGNFQFTLNQLLETDTYDPNDLGYNQRNNKFENSLALQYNIYEPFWKLLDWHNALYIWYNCLYEDLKFTSLNVRAETRLNTRKYLTIGSNTEFNPVEGRDFYEPRVPGKYVIDNPGGNLIFWISTDYRKKFALDSYVAGYYSPAYPIWAYAFSLGPRFQPNPRLTLVYSLECEFLKNIRGYVMDSLDAQNEPVVIFGNRDVNTIVNQIEGNFMFNSKMSLNLQARHYWVTAIYDSYYDLGDDGHLIPNNYTGDNNINYNLLNIDLSFIWNFLPGSQISLVWKNAITTFGSEIDSDYFRNFCQMIESPASNSFSVRVLVYLDALYFKKKNKK